ncbi:hypothetical protein HL41_06330 [Thermodesulfobacterium commune DSM 2178]|uniref:Uncharacterized protein n=1 Tax=Thermodesulfobacterium commune DSM 2178 TaxID=289377 RepID=A0A075WV88_9BACT|nr:hypothetical protein HL41_06330 [Thermodesulfobacterium commune DSM 2178]
MRHINWFCPFPPFSYTQGLTPLVEDYTRKTIKCKEQLTPIDTRLKALRTFLKDTKTTFVFFPNLAFLLS